MAPLVSHHSTEVVFWEAIVLFLRGHNRTKITMSGLPDWTGMELILKCELIH